ncbi:MAG: hypothetical protein GQ477_02340, partial [Nanohaloarchaea archaeon]|nr:hypothetical protein [Candidatus Nanohaloarchaea archaeon]
DNNLPSYSTETSILPDIIPPDTSHTAMTMSLTAGSPSSFIAAIKSLIDRIFPPDNGYAQSKNNAKKTKSIKDKKIERELEVAERLGLESTSKGWTKKQNTDSLKIYTDHALYTDSDSEIIITVENPSNRPENVDLTTYFPSDSKVNIDYIHVLDSGSWSEISQAERKDSKNSWNNNKKYDKIPKGHVSATPLTGHNIPANSVIQFRMTYNTRMHDIFTEEFYVEVFGDKGGYGSLDPEISQTEGWWRDNFTDETGVDSSYNITVVSEMVNLTASSSYGNISSNSISPTASFAWDTFYANDSVSAAQGTNITYKILNASDNSTLCSITEDQADTGYNISTCASSASSIRLFANLTTTDTSYTPELYDWNVSWSKEIYISGCSVLDQEGMTYVMTSDITNSGASLCINISANDVTLDCQGHKIDGNDITADEGIQVYRTSSTDAGVTIKNCVVTDWTLYGIYLYNVNHTNITGVNSSSNLGGRAFNIIDSSLGTFTNITAISNSIGFYVEDSFSNSFTDITSNSNSKGFYISDSSFNNVTNATLNYNTYGIHIIYSSDNNIIADSIITGNTDAGLYLDQSTVDPEYNKIYNNFFNNSGTNENVLIDTGIANPNYFNTTKQSGTRIYTAGTDIGGNFWTNSTGNGYSDTCADSNGDGFCDTAYNLSYGSSVAYDHHPLTYDTASPTIDFVSPSPDDNEYINKDYTYINVTTNDTSNTTAFIDWNNSLVGWWRFNQETGENNTFFRDWSTYGNNGTCSGSNCSIYTTGKFGQALDFDGADDYVNCGNDSSLDITSAITIEAWVKSDSPKLIGLPDDATQDHLGGSEYFILDKFTASANGTINTIRVHHNAPVKVKVAIYDDDGGEPGTLLNAVNTNQSVSSGWSNINFPSTQVTSGTVYWLAYASEADYHFWQQNTGGIQKFKSIVFSSFTFPSSAGTGFTPCDDISHIAGYNDKKLIISKGQDAYALEMSLDGSTLKGYINNSEITASVSAPLEWHHYALTYNGSNQKLYLYGNQTNSTSLTGNINTNANNLTIGKYFNGIIDEVRIYNRALTAEEINASYNAGLYRLEANLTDLEEGAYTYTAYAQDEMGNLNNTETRTLTVDTIPPYSINTCQSLTIENGIYELVGNVSSDATCFTIEADNITLDCAGYTINYSQSSVGYAINNSGGSDNITIKNCNVVQGSTSQDAYAIYGYEMENSTIDNNIITTYGSYSHAVCLNSSSILNNITNNTIMAYGSWGYGIYLVSSDSNTIADNNITNPGDGAHTLYAVSSSYLNVS